MMNPAATIECEVELHAGEKLHLPESLTEQIGEGRWLVTVAPVSQSPARLHEAFLNSYSPEDEGLYDDTPAR